MTTPRHVSPAFRMLLVGTLALLPLSAFAGQTPLTGNMLGRSAASPAAAPTHGPQTPPASAQPVAAAPLPPPAPVQLAMPYLRGPGNATRHLLDLQASGRAAGGTLPITGEQAQASYARYLRSFEHPIPEYFDGNVGKTPSAEGR